MTLTVNQLRGRIRSRQRVRGVGVALLLLAVATLVIAWVYELTYRPRLTPIFVAVVTDYAWPVDPNPWAREDLELLSTLHRGTLNVHDMSSEWRSRDLAIRRLDSELASFVAEREVPETVVSASMAWSMVRVSRTCCRTTPHRSSRGVGFRCRKWPTRSVPSSRRASRNW
jgi:hypothetical protein